MTPCDGRSLFFEFRDFGFQIIDLLEDVLDLVGFVGLEFCSGEYFLGFFQSLPENFQSLFGFLVHRSPPWFMGNRKKTSPAIKAGLVCYTSPK